MSNLLFIFTSVILPVFIQIGVGFFIYKKFTLNLQTLAKIQFYAFIPALLFNRIYLSDTEGGAIFMVVVFAVALFFILAILATLASRLFGFDIKREKSLVNAATLINAGNFSLPLIELLYAGPLVGVALTFQVFFMLCQNILMNTFGLLNCTFGRYSVKDGLLTVLRMPIIYAIAIAFTLKGLHINVPAPIMSATEIMSRALVPVAIFTLGAQLADTKIHLKSIAVYVPVLLRLVVSPLVGFLLITVLGIEGLMAQVLLIASAAPSAVNSLLLAIEFDADPEYASQTVFLTTLLSAITVSVVIMIAQNLYPL